MATTPGSSMHKTDESVTSKSTTSSPPPSIIMGLKRDKLRYVNNLLPAVGYLDLANGLDFPANVWNQIPVPKFAKVLMAVGGSIILLSTVFAYVDLRRSGRNVAFLRHERQILKHRRLQYPQTWRIERSWLDVNSRELGWELIDRMLLDICMLIAGVLVGIGTLMAMYGQYPTIYFVSNLLSGYIGNSFVALYAVTNLAWSIFMWRRAARNNKAFKQMNIPIRPEIRRRFREHTRRHKIFAIVNGPTAVVSGVGSLISATMWPGYVVLIPGIVGSVFANHFWRFKLGYSRDAIQEWTNVENMDILERIGVIVSIRCALRATNRSDTNYCALLAAPSGEKPTHAVVSFLRDHGLYYSFLNNLIQNGFVAETEFTGPEQALYTVPNNDWSKNVKITAAVNKCILDADPTQFRYEERFLSELYGCYCYWYQVNRGKPPSTSAVDVEP